MDCDSIDCATSLILSTSLLYPFILLASQYAVNCSPIRRQPQ